MKNLSFLVVFAAVLVSGLLTGCGGGSGGGAAPVILKGVFKDSNVQGLSYISGGQKGVTDNKGAFKYEKNSQVAFSIGGVQLGSALGKPIISPLDLVSNGNLASDAVINRVRFLMMLDKDNKPSNGIEISQKVQQKAKDWSALDFAQTSSQFQADQQVIDYTTDASVEDAKSHRLPSKEDAVAHLKTTLLCSYAGGFTGSYSGDKSGNIALMVDPATGNLTGSSYDSASQVSVDVNSKSPIDYDKGLEFVSAEDSGKEFSGKFSSTEALSGTWKDTNTPSIKGDFVAARLGGASDAVYRYTASYAGSDKGLFVFDVDANNNVKVKVFSVSKNKVDDLTGKLTDNGKTLKAKQQNGIDINAVVNPADNTILGVWTNLTAITTGTLTGGGCKLN